MTNYIVRTIEGHDIPITAEGYHVNQAGMLEVGTASFAPGKWLHVGASASPEVSPLDGSTIGTMCGNLTDIAFYLANGVHTATEKATLIGSLKVLEDLTLTLKHEVEAVAYAG